MLISLLGALGTEGALGGATRDAGNFILCITEVSLILLLPVTPGASPKAFPPTAAAEAVLESKYPTGLLWPFNNSTSIDVFLF